MIRPKCLNAPILAVRDLERSLAWYREHFGFERQFDAPNCVVIGDGGVLLCLSQVSDPENARKADEAKDVCIRLIAFEVTDDDLARAAEEFAGDEDLVWMDEPNYRSCITEDPDGHAIELYILKP